jgi:archaellum biogenesis ATPase FlaH
MARLVPSSFPDEQGRNAEKAFYDACLTGLTEDWIGLYSQHYVGSRPSLGQRQGSGESDFILLSKNFGIIVVEVKGGQIDISEGQWFSTGLKGRFKVKNPFVQAEEGSQAILATLKRELQEIRLVNCVHHCVAFPDVPQRSVKDISTYGPHEIIIVKEDLRNINSKLEQIAAHWGQKPKWNDADFQRIKNVLIPTMKTPGVSYLEYVKILEGLNELTESQKRTIRQLTKDRGRSVVTGGAGTGKTVLGMYRAEQLALDGKKVLYICATPSLAQHLQAEVDASITPIPENLVIDSVARFITNEGLSGLTGDAAKQLVREVPKRRDRFLNAIEQSGREASIDCLVVDEAQDITRKDLDLLEHLVKLPQDNGSVIILGDPNQQLFLRRAESALGADGQNQMHSLDVNCRNTHEIASIAHEFTNQIVYTLESVSGIKVRKSRIQESLSGQVASEIERIRHEYNPEHIVVLTLNGIADLDLQNPLYIDGQRWEKKPSSNSEGNVESVLVYSARLFQGREADAVVVALTEKSLLRTFPFTRFAEEMQNNRQVMDRQQSKNDLQSVEGMYKRYINSGIQTRLEKFDADLETNGSNISEKKRIALRREFEYSCELDFEPRFSDPFLHEKWKARQRQSLKVSLYSMMTRARVILSIVGDKKVFRIIESELSSKDGEIEEYLQEA